jgi:hypothetical protein
MKIEIETWPESTGWPEPGPANTPPSPEGRWRLIQVVLSARDADAEQTERLTSGGQQDA